MQSHPDFAQHFEERHHQSTLENDPSDVIAKHLESAERSPAGHFHSILTLLLSNSCSTIIIVKAAIAIASNESLIHCIATTQCCTQRVLARTGALIRARKNVLLALALREPAIVKRSRAQWFCGAQIATLLRRASVGGRGAAARRAKTGSEALAVGAAGEIVAVARAFSIGRGAGPYHGETQCTRRG